MKETPTQSFTKNFASLLTGMKVTLENFIKKPVTLEYPYVKKEASPGPAHQEPGHLYLPERSRGVLRMVDFFDATTTVSKSDHYPGTKFAPCIEGCPAHTDARGYVTLAGEGRFKEGVWQLKRTYPFLGTLGRVCPAPCEDLCTRGIAGPEPIAIRRIKRFLDDFEQELPPAERYYYSKEMKPLIGKKAAVVGAGPSGLQVALELVLEGFTATVYERKPIPMGYVGLTIPRNRLADEVWQREVAAIMETGRVEIKYNTTISVDITMDQLRQENDVVIIAAGATKPIKLGIPGEDAENVAEGEPWLEAVKLDKPFTPGKRVVVVGGGSTSTDCARTALRLGAETAIITYRRTRAEMPASPLEVEDALEEGVIFEYLVSPLEIVKEGNRGVGLKCIRNKLGPRDKSGRRAPVPIEGSEFVIPGDLFMTSLGRNGAMGWLGDEYKKQRNGLLEVDRDTNETSVPGVYGCGDSVRVSTIIAAIGDAKKTAHAIFKKFGIDPTLKDLYATGGWVPNVDGTIPNASQRKKVTTPPPGNFVDEAPWKGLPYDKPFTTHLWKTQMQMQDPATRLKNWDECEFGFTTEQVLQEGQRCLSCESEMCIACGICVDVCPDSVIFLKSESVSPEQKDVKYASLYSIDLNLCCYCGLCTEACPTKSIVMTGDYEFSVYNKGNNLITMDRLKIGLERVPAKDGYVNTGFRDKNDASLPRASKVPSAK